MTQQLTRDDLAGMTPDQIEEAHDHDRLTLVLGANPDQAALLDRAHDPNYLLTAADIKALRAANRDDLIVAAYEADRIATNPGESR